MKFDFSQEAYFDDHTHLLYTEKLSCTAEEFADCVGETVELKIENLDILAGKVLTGVIIRSTDNKGNYIVGGRLLEDNLEIQNYVKTRVNA